MKIELFLAAILFSIGSVACASVAEPSDDTNVVADDEQAAAASPSLDPKLIQSPIGEVYWKCPDNLVSYELRSTCESRCVATCIRRVVYSR